MLYQVIIPARGGSKRFPRKNVVLFQGKPLIAHSIEFALKSFPKENIWVNTDDEEIASIANSYGIQLTMRPNLLGTDIASTADVLAYQYEVFQKKDIRCDALILLQATNPLRPKNLIENCISEFELCKRESLASFSKLNRKYGKIVDGYFKPTNYKPGQRMQDIVPEYFENGLIYITKVEQLKNGNVITEDVMPFIFDGIESIVDIDEQGDIAFAEYVYKKINSI